MKAYFIVPNYANENIFYASVASLHADCEAYFAVLNADNDGLEYDEENDIWVDEDGDEASYFEESDFDVLEFSLKRVS